MSCPIDGLHNLFCPVIAVLDVFFDCWTCGSDTYYGFVSTGDRAFEGMDEHAGVGRQKSAHSMGSELSLIFGSLVISINVELCQ